jgi:hypothetical protein
MAGVNRAGVSNPRYFRAVPLSPSLIVTVVMQRINDNDLSAHVLATTEERYVHLKIEAEATGHQVFSFPRSPRIFTRKPGHAPAPRVYGRPILVAMKLRLPRLHQW